MTDHPLLLSTPMVRATIAGNKDITHRIPGPTNSFVDGKRVSGKKWKEYCFDWSTANIVGNSFSVYAASKVGAQFHYVSPIYQPGDTIWFRETWCAEQLPQPPEGDWDKIIYRYKASEEFDPATLWRPSIHMPKEAARLWASVTSCRCEHLNYIAEEQAKREGVDRIVSDGVVLYKNYSPGCDTYEYEIAIDSFKTLWASIHGWDSWPANPPVYAIEFKLLSTTGKPG